MLKILVHDWSGHPFQIALSRELARRGFYVHHTYFIGVQGPKGPLERRPNDPPNFVVTGRSIPQTYAKYNFVRRWFQERRYAREIAQFIRAERPDVVISSNTPLDVQRAMAKATAAVGGTFVFWLQDIISVAMSTLLGKKYPVLGSAVAWHYRSIERSLLRHADHVVCICDDFSDVMRDWNVESGRCSVIENWASREEISPLPKDNPWSRAHSLTKKTVLLYAGTLSIKHDPTALLQLAEENAGSADFAVVVASEGPGADWLRAQAAERQMKEIIVLPFQPYDVLPQMLASADVLLGLIEAEAAQFSVPSKILSYLAAGRALILSAPLKSFAARLVTQAETGIVTAPGDRAGFLAAARSLASDVELRNRYAVNARRYAEEKFDIEKIGDRFVDLIGKSRDIRPV